MNGEKESYNQQFEIRSFIIAVAQILACRDECMLDRANKQMKNLMHHKANAYKRILKRIMW